MAEHMHEALTVVPELGTAATCTGYGAHRPVPVRFVWHHVLPQVCGGKTVAENLAELCDNCHFTVHAIMYFMARNAGQLPQTVRGTRGQRHLAIRGYNMAVLSGTVSKIPNEGSIE